MRTIITALLLLLIQTVLFANDTQKTQWDKANNLYNSQHYDSAVMIYHALLRERTNNSDIYYNLGNCYYRLNDIKNAVLNYQRCLALNPNNNLAKENLELTKSRIPNRIQPVQKIFFIQWWQNITKGSYAIAWSIVALILFLIIIIIGYLLQYMSLIKQRIPNQIYAGIIVIWVIAITFAFIATSNKVKHSLAVVMINDSPFMEEPNSNKPISLIPEGTTVNTINNINDWTEITLPNGRKGWIRTDLIEKI